MNLLLVEDSIADITLIEEFIEELRLPVELSVFHDGDRALRSLRQWEGREKPRRPDLILLDLNLPGYDGMEVLQQLRSDPDPCLRVIPVVVLTTSAAAADIRGAYEHAANAYVTKPIDSDGMRRVLQAITSFWFQTAQLPGRCMA